MVLLSIMVKRIIWTLAFPHKWKKKNQEFSTTNIRAIKVQTKIPNSSVICPFPSFKTCCCILLGKKANVTFFWWWWCWCWWALCWWKLNRSNSLNRNRGIIRRVIAVLKTVMQKKTNCMPLMYNFYMVKFAK